MKRLLFIYTILLLSFNFCSAKKIDIVTMDFPPYVYKENGEIKGFNVEILNEIFKRMDIKVNYKIKPWARAVLMIKNKQADAIFPFLKNKERESFAIYPEPFTSEPLTMFVLKNSNIKYNGDLTELVHYCFGRVRGYSTGEKFDNFIKNYGIRIQTVKNTKQNLNKFLNRRFHILVDNRYVILHKLKEQNSLNKVKELTPILSEKEAYLGLSKLKKNEEIRKKFNVILKEIKEDGTYSKILNNYFKR